MHCHSNELIKTDATLSPVFAFSLDANQMLDRTDHTCGSMLQRLNSRIEFFFLNSQQLQLKTGLP